MNKNKTLYFRKTHKLFIHLIALRGEYHFNYSSASYGDSEDIVSTTTIQPNKIIEVTTIDVLEKGKEILDSEVTLDVYLLHSKMKHMIGRVSFDLKREKILNPSSSEFYKKSIKQGDGLIDGYIQYKFVSLNTAEITEDTFNESLSHKNEIEIEEKNLEVSKESKKLLTILAEKDGVIRAMEEQVQKLMNETKRLSTRDQETKETGKINPISLSINMKPSNRTETEHKRLIRENEILKVRVIKYGEIIEKIEKEKRALLEEIDLLNDLNAAKKDGEISAQNASIIEEKRAFIEELKKSAANLVKTGEKQAREMRLQDLPEYSQINKKVQEETEGLRVQLRGGKWQEVGAERETLLDKLKKSIKEIDLLKSEIENMHVYIRKLTDELKILRKNTSSEGIMAKIEAIRNENEKMIEELKQRGGLVAEEQMYIYKQENYLIEIELLKKDNEEMSSRFEVYRADLDRRYKEEELKISRLLAKEAETARERDVYKAQLDEAKASLEKYFANNVTHEKIGETAEGLSRQLSSALKLKETLEKNLTSEKAAFANLRDRYDQLLQDNKWKGEEIGRLRSLEVANRSLTQRLNSQDLQIKSYQKKYNELKAMAKTFDTAFRRGRQAPEEKIDGEMLEKLQNFEKMVKESEKEYVSLQLQALQEEKERIIEDYYNDIKKEQERIDADDYLQPEQKKTLKESKELELTRIKQVKLEAIEARLAECMVKRQEIENRLGESMSLPLRLATLEKAVKSKQASVESENQELKRSIAKLKETEAIKTEQINQLKESQTKLSGSGVISGVQLTAYQEGRARFMEEFNRINDENKRKLKVAFDETKELKAQVRTLEATVERQRGDFLREKKNMENAFKEKEHQMDVERAKVENTANFKAKKIETCEAEISKLKEERAELSECCNRLSSELELVSQENTTNVEKIIELNGDVERLRGAIDDSNKGMDLMMETMEQVRREEEQKVVMMQQLLEERSDTFVKIEKVKDSEIGQLKRLLREIEDKAEAETYEAIKLKEANVVLNEQLEALAKEKAALEEARRLQEENFRKEAAERELQIAGLEEGSQELQRQLLSIAEEFDKAQEEAAVGRVRIAALEKEAAVFAGLESRIAEVTLAKQREREEMDYVIADKKEQLQKYTTELLLLQERLKMLSEENQKIRMEVTRFQDENERMKDKLSEKSLEVISLAEQKSLTVIEKARKEAELEESVKRCRELDKEMEALRGELFQLKEALRLESQNRKLNRKESHRENRISRKVSVDDIILKTPPSISISATPEGPREVEVIENLHSLGVIQAIEEDALDEQPSRSQQDAAQQDAAQDNLETKSVRSDRSNMTRKSALSRVSKRRESRNYYSRTPEMVEVSGDRAAREEREMELLRALQEAEGERDELAGLLAEMKVELESLRQAPSERRSPENIRIDDSGSQPASNSATFSLVKPNFLDSRELNNTHEATDKDHSKDIQSYELLIEELERERDSLGAQLEEERQNVEKLLRASEELQQDRDELLGQLEQARRECEERALEGEEARREGEQRAEQLIAEIMQKETALGTALRELEESQERADRAEQEIGSLEMALEEREGQAGELTQTIQRIKGEYRKYEEEAELEILTLRERFDELMGVAGEKNEDIQELVKKYLCLEESHQQEGEHLRRVEAELALANNKLLLLQQDNDKIGTEREEYAEARRNAGRRVHELEVELLSQNEKLVEASKTMGLLASKGSIRAEALEQQLADVRGRLDEKDRVVVALKNEIALYNEECAELKRANDDLDYELQRATKELKDIMLSYEREFQTMNKEKLGVLESTKQYDVLLREKEQKLSEMRAELRENERERVKAENDLKDTRDQFQRFRNVKGRELSQKCTEYELLNNETEILKSAQLKLTEENYLLEGQLEEERRRGRTLHEEYRQKMARYEESLEEVSKELVLLADRPSKEAWEQALFENQLFRNRVEELEEEGRKRAVSSDDLVTAEFRKYKVRSETVIRSLEQEMESYSGKVNELEEGNYYLKRENEALRVQLTRLGEAREELEDQIRCLEDDVSDLREEVEFYKGRRRQELTKLLNATDD